MMLASSNALKSSAMYIGYLILKEIQKRDTCLLYTSDAADE